MVKPGGHQTIDENDKFCVLVGGKVATRSKIKIFEPGVGSIR